MGLVISLVISKTHSPSLIAGVMEQDRQRLAELVRSHEEEEQQQQEQSNK